VQYRVNESGGFKPARLTNGRLWTINAPLRSGKNIVYVRTVDSRTGASTTIKVVVVRE
jgi:hypothetical protein